MQHYTNVLFKDSGLQWISGYFLPEALEQDTNKYTYVAQLGLSTAQPREHAVITCSNLKAWTERYSEGQKAAKLASEKGLHLVFQMVPSHPGWVYLNCFIPVSKKLFVFYKIKSHFE